MSTPIKRKTNQLLGSITSRVAGQVMLNKKGPWRQAARDVSNWLFDWQYPTLYGPESRILPPTPAFPAGRSPYRYRNAPRK